MTESYREIAKEHLPESLEIIPSPRNFFEIEKRITRKFLRETPESQGGATEVDVVDGFEDILYEPFGAGFFYNTPTSVFQLAFVLSVSPNPVVNEVLGNVTLSPRETIEMLRQNQVLSGLKIIDLGCGQPNFALVAHALGAQVYTADAEDIPNKYKETLDGHVVIDLNNSEAIRVLQEATGGNFDIVTENIAGGTPSTPRNLKTLSLERLTRISEILLKKGGHLYTGLNFTIQLYRKI